MALAVSNQKRQGGLVKGQLTASGSYATGGDTFDTTVLLQPGIARVPFDVLFKSRDGYVYSFVPNANPALCKVKVLCNTAGGANAALGEHTAAAYNAAVIADEITFTAFLPAR
jgi:hypothetical protein